MDIAYKIYYANRGDSSMTMVIHTTYQMVVKGKEFDIYEVIHEQLMENLKKKDLMQWIPLRHTPHMRGLLIFERDSIIQSQSMKNPPTNSYSNKDAHPPIHKQKYIFHLTY